MLHRFTQLMPLWVVVLGVVGYLWPATLTWFRKQIDRIHDVFPALSTVCIAVICGMVVALNQSKLSSLTFAIFAAIFLHNLVGYLGGYGAGRLYRFDKRMTRTLSVEVGMQNAGLGAVLAIKHFSPETALVPALFATWCVITASLLARYWGRAPEVALSAVASAKAEDRTSEERCNEASQ